VEKSCSRGKQGEKAQARQARIPRLQRRGAAQIRHESEEKEKGKRIKSETLNLFCCWPVCCQKSLGSIHCRICLMASSLSAFLGEIGRHQLLTPEQELTLGRKVQTMIGLQERCS